MGGVAVFPGVCSVWCFPSDGVTIRSAILPIRQRTARGLEHIQSCSQHHTVPELPSCTADLSPLPPTPAQPSATTCCVPMGLTPPGTSVGPTVQSPPSRVWLISLSTTRPICGSSCPRVRPEAEHCLCCGWASYVLALDTELHPHLSC